MVGVAVVVEADGEAEVAAPAEAVEAEYDRAQYDRWEVCAERTSWHERREFVDEVDTLRDLIADRHAHAEIGLKIDRSADAVRGMAQRQGFVSPSRWTEEAIATLRDLIADGHTHAEIGLKMGRSASAVGWMARSLGFVSSKSFGSKPR